MSVFVRSLRPWGPAYLAVSTLALVACATAQDPDVEIGNGDPQPAGGSSGSGGGGGSGGVATAGKGGVVTGGSPATGGSQPMTTGGKANTGGTPSTTGGAATTGGTATGTGGGSTSSCTAQYSGTQAKDSTIFNGGFGKSTTGSWSGYAYTYKYGTGATISPGTGNGCFQAAKLCANGSVPAADSAGAGLGWNISQMQGASTMSKVAVTTPVSLKLAGVAAGMRVQLSASSTVSYCYTLTAADAAGSVTIPLASFKTECWGTEGVAYDGATPIEAIQVVVPGAAAAAKTFDFCLLDIEPG